jgi:hypothetical protein
MASALDHQRAAATLILAVISGDDFALAGSGAIREHGLIDRPTLDIDLFAIQGATDRFPAAVDRSIATSRSTATALFLPAAPPNSPDSQ